MTRSAVIEYDGMTMPAPRFATQRNYDRPTLGTRRRDFARIWLRKPLLPWQCLVADVTGELDPTTMLPYYDMVVVTVQRRAGKSHLSMTKTAERCVSVPGWRAWYTAQTGSDARDAFLEFDEDVIDGTPLAGLRRTLRGNGHEVMRFANGSTLRPHPPTEKSLHGKSSDDNDIDEAWAFSSEDGRLLMQAISPTQATRPAAQTWVWSAGGTPQSTWLAQLVADGRAGRVPVTNDDPRVAYFEWGIPDDMDLDDLEGIASYHPAYGHTVSLAALRRMRTQLPDDADYARAAGNRWTEIIGGAIPAGDWLAVRCNDPIPDHVPVTYGAARAADGSHVVLTAAAPVGDRVLVEVLDVMPAFAPAERIQGWVGDDPVAVLPTGPSASLRDDLALGGVRLYDMTGRDEATGVQQLLDAIAARAVAFRQHQVLDDAVKVTGTRRVADGGKAWARVAAGAPIAAIESATVAVWGVRRRPVPVPAPVIHVRAS